MKNFATYAFFAALLGWGLTAMTGMHLLSGSFEARTCQTMCVQGYFLAAVVFGVTGLLLGLVTLPRASSRIWSKLALLVSVPLCGVFAVLYYTGNYL